MDPGSAQVLLAQVLHLAHHGGALLAGGEVLPAPLAHHHQAEQLDATARNVTTPDIGADNLHVTAAELNVVTPLAVMDVPVVADVAAVTDAEPKTAAAVVPVLTLTCDVFRAAAIVMLVVPMVIVSATDVGRSGYESKAELDADALLIARLESIRVEAGIRMGLGDCSKLVVPKPVLVAPPRNGGTIASRDFVPFNCHATYSVTGSMALVTACMLPGTVAHGMARLKGPGRQTVAIEHPSGIIEVDVSARHSGSGFVLEEASMLRTCRKLFEGTICIPASIWDGKGRALDAMQLASAI